LIIEAVSPFQGERFQADSPLGTKEGNHELEGLETGDIRQGDTFGASIL
jgi:hypothetical protein